MTAAERGLLLLTCRLGRDREPINVWQFHEAAELIRRSDLLEESGELTRTRLEAMGFSAAYGERILNLLGEEDALERYLRAAAKAGVTVVTRLDPAYPERLEQRLKGSAPPVLFCKGDPALFHSPCVSVVGSRVLNGEGRAFARRVGSLAARQGLTLVSGNAAGADSAAQEACLRAGGSVISFLPSQLSSVPARERVLYVSEEGFEVPFSSQRALARNRLIHAMGQRVFVAQCNYGRGGTWRGTSENLQKGYSPVFVHRDGSAGAIALERMGAVGVAVPEDFLSICR